MRSNYLNFTVVAVIFLALTIGCGSLTTAKPAADKAIAEFHILLNDGKFQQIYDSSDSALKEAATFEKINELFEAVNRKLGKVVSTKNQNFNVRTFNLTTQATIVQDTKFERGDATETFTFKVDGDKAVLQGYYINSMDLITK